MNSSVKASEVVCKGNPLPWPTCLQPPDLSSASRLVSHLPTCHLRLVQSSAGLQSLQHALLHSPFRSTIVSDWLSTSTALAHHMTCTVRGTPLHQTRNWADWVTSLLRP